MELCNPQLLFSFNNGESIVMSAQEEWQGLVSSFKDFGGTSGSGVSPFLQKVLIFLPRVPFTFSSPDLSGILETSFLNCPFFSKSFGKKF